MNQQEHNFITLAFRVVGRPNVKKRYWVLGDIEYKSARRELVEAGSEVFLEVFNYIQIMWETDKIKKEKFRPIYEGLMEVAENIREEVEDDGYSSD